MTKNRPSRKDSARSAERIFAEKAKWHRQQARASFARKLAVLDDMFEDAKRSESPSEGQPIDRPTGEVRP